MRERKACDSSKALCQREFKGKQSRIAGTLSWILSITWFPKEREIKLQEDNKLLISSPFPIHRSKEKIGTQQNRNWELVNGFSIWFQSVTRTNLNRGEGNQRASHLFFLMICGSRRITGSWIPRAPMKGFWWHLHVGSSILWCHLLHPENGSFRVCIVWEREWRNERQRASRLLTPGLDNTRFKEDLRYKPQLLNGVWNAVASPSCLGFLFTKPPRLSEVTAAWCPSLSLSRGV